MGTNETGTALGGDGMLLPLQSSRSILRGAGRLADSVPKRVADAGLSVPPLPRSQKPEVGKVAAPVCTDVCALLHL